MRRNLIILLIVVLAIAAGFIFFTKDEVIFTKETSMYKAVPVSTPLFVELKSLKTIPLDNYILSELLLNDVEALYLKDVARLDSIISNEAQVPNSLRNANLLIAFDFVGEDQIFPLIVAKAESNSKLKAIDSFIKVLYPVNKFIHKEEPYNNHQIKTVTDNAGKELLHYSTTRGLALISIKRLLVEQSLRQLDAESITENEFFSQVNKTVTAQSDIAWYINHQTFSELASIWLNNRTQRGINEFGENTRLNYKTEFSGFGKLAEWTELDARINEKEIVFNGISVAEDSLHHFLSVFEGQEPARYTIDKVLPGNVSYCTFYSLSDKQLFFENLEEYFVHTDSYYRREDRLKKIDAGFRTNFKSTFQELAENEIAVAISSMPSSGEKSTLFVVQTKNKSDAEQQLNSLLEVYAKRKNIEPGSLKKNFAADTENQFTIYHFPFPSFPGLCLGKPFGLVKANYATLYEGYLVFANTEKGIQDYLNSMLQESTLAKDLRYQKSRQNWINRSTINSFVNINRSFKLSQELFNTKTAKKIKDNEEFIRRFQTISWQIVCEKGSCFNSINLSFYQETEEEAKTTWRSPLGADVIGKPLLMQNHRDPANKEIVAQDNENNLHQINKDGNLNWTIEISGKIMGRIHQIDYFRNGRLQYLFNTKDKLYIVDREGNNVAHFPIEFQTPATNAVNVFDYDNNRKYRYFVACEDKKVYAYNYDGRLLTGWTFESTQTEVTTPIQHFRVNNLDYIVFKDRTQIYIQNRRGETRVKTKLEFEQSESPLQLNLDNKAKIVATDSKGRIYYSYFDGTVEEKDLGKFSKNHRFLIKDLDGNKIPDFVFTDGRQLKVVDENGKKWFTKRFRNEVSYPPAIYSFASNIKKIGIVEASANRIHLFDISGKLHEGFPLQGNSSFTIGEISKNSGQLNLLVGGNGGELYNYTFNK